jgi:hypothetical protein
MDRDTKYAQQFWAVGSGQRDQGDAAAAVAPNLNAYAERFVRWIKDECLDRMIFVGQASLRRAVGEYVEHYH